MRYRHATLGLAFLAVVVRPLTASAVSFDTDGGGPLTSQPMTGFTYSAGNALLDNFLPVTVGSTVQYLYQARVSSVLDGAGNPFTPTGLNSAFELTTVASTTMLVTNLVVASGVSTASVVVAPVQSPNSFIEFWFDTTPDANSLLGTGFNDGTRILAGIATAPLSGLSSFSTTAAPITNFDQFGVNDYPGILSLPVTGTTATGFSIVLSDPSFFSALPSGFTLATVDGAPFTATDPSHFFTAFPGGVAPTLFPNIGTVNGVSGPDLQLQSTGSSTFAAPTAVPEPTAAVLLCLGIGFAVAARRRLYRPAPHIG